MKNIQVNVHCASDRREETFLWTYQSPVIVIQTTQRAKSSNKQTRTKHNTHLTKGKIPDLCLHTTHYFICKHLDNLLLVHYFALCLHLNKITFLVNFIYGLHLASLVVPTIRKVFLMIYRYSQEGLKFVILQDPSLSTTEVCGCVSVPCIHQIFIIPVCMWQHILSC